jgi:alpha,alpha-trehalose phosphorylase (configuration-retaining)
MDIVPYIFNIKPYHPHAITRPNIKHRFSSATGSYVPSGTDTPTVYLDSAQLKAMSGLQADVSSRLPMIRTLDEQADSAARKCLSNYGPGNNPRLQIGPRNQVLVDAAGQIHLIDDIAEYKATVGPRYCMVKFINMFFLTLC